MYTVTHYAFMRRSGKETNVRNVSFRNASDAWRNFHAEATSAEQHNEFSRPINLRYVRLTETTASGKIVTLRDSGR